MLVLYQSTKLGERNKKILTRISINGAELNFINLFGITSRPGCLLFLRFLIQEVTSFLVILWPNASGIHVLPDNYVSSALRSNSSVFLFSNFWK